jgi:DNA repair protein RadD
MLRQYQQELKYRCYHSWNEGRANLIPVLPTGGGKTAVMSDIAHEHDGYGVGLAHRSVLVGQLSQALARAGLKHDIIAQKAVVKTIVMSHMEDEDIGRSFYVPGAPFKIGSVDTMPGRAAMLSSWIAKCDMGFTDEAHHVLLANKWGRECQRFTNPKMRWLLPTATPERGDGKGLGRNAEGIADEIIEGPNMRWHIENGYLTDYLVRAPMPADLDLSDVEVGANGEYNLKQLRRAVHRSTKIIGDVVGTYLKHTAGKLGIVFAVDIEHAQKLTDEFNKKGVKAELITADHDEDQRRLILKRYRNRETLVLVNVDLFGEGFDLPAIEVVMMARPTASYSLFAQQWGRGLRLGVLREYLKHWESYTVAQRLAIIAHSIKPVAFIHDHVGNTLHFYGPPDKPREWSLESRRASRGPSDAIPLRVCLNATCMHPYERYLTACPMCGTEAPLPPVPTLPEQVDGDLTLYTPEMMRRLFGVDTFAQALGVQPSERLVVPQGSVTSVVLAAQKNLARKLHAQARLASLMPLVMPPHLTQREAMRRFYHRFGIDVVQARMLGGVETEALVERIVGVLTNRK